MKARLDFRMASPEGMKAMGDSMLSFIVAASIRFLWS